MSDIENLRYDYLNRKRYIVHEVHFPPLSPEALKEVSRYEAIEYYSREKILHLSKLGLLQTELKKHIDDLLRLRVKYPEGSNQECICMDFITELISKLDLEDFRKLRIERLVE